MTIGSLNQKMIAAITFFLLLGCQAKGPSFDESLPQSEMESSARRGTFSVQRDQRADLPDLVLAAQENSINAWPYPSSQLTAVRSRTKSGYLELIRNTSTNYISYVTPISLQRLALGQITTNSPSELIFVDFFGESGRVELEFYRETSAFGRVERRVVLPISGGYHFGKMNFFLLKNRDLMGVKYKDTGSNSLEVHILTAESNYQRFSLQTGTSMSEQEASYYRCQARTLDLICVRDDINDRVQVRILNPATNYRNNKLLVRSDISVSGILSWEFEMYPPSRISGNYFGTIYYTPPKMEYTIRFATKPNWPGRFSWRTSTYPYQQEPMISLPLIN